MDSLAEELVAAETQQVEVVRAHLDSVGGSLDGKPRAKPTIPMAGFLDGKFDFEFDDGGLFGLEGLMGITPEEENEVMDRKAKLQELMHKGMQELFGSIKAKGEEASREQQLLKERLASKRRRVEETKDSATEAGVGAAGAPGVQSNDQAAAVPGQDGVEPPSEDRGTVFMGEALARAKAAGTTAGPGKGGATGKGCS